MDASEISPRRLNAEEVLPTHKDGEFAFLVADGSATLSGSDCEVQESTLRQEHTLKRANLSGESLKAIGKRFNLKKQKRTRKLGKTSVLFKEILIYRRHVELGVQFSLSEEESFPFPLKYVAVIRSIRTDSDLMHGQELGKPPNEDRNKNGQSRNRNSTMPEI